MLLKFAFRIIGRSQNHSFRSIRGFALVIAMILSISGVISGFSTQIFGMTEKIGESPSIYIQAKDPNNGISSEIIELMNHTNIKSVLPIMEKMVSFDSEKGSFKCNAVGLNISRFMDYYPRSEIFVGRFPYSNSSIPECLVGKDLMKIIGSSKINISDGSIETEKQINIVGTVQNVGEFQNAILFNISDYFEIMDQNPNHILYQRVKIVLKNGHFVEETIDYIKIHVKGHLQNLVVKPEQQADTFVKSLFSDIIKQLTLLFYVLFIIALFRIFHSISWFVRNYERDLLIMRSLGLSSSQLIFLVVLLSVIISNVGLIAGILFGIIVPLIIFTLLTLIFKGESLIPNFTISTMLTLSILSNFIAIVASLYPAIQISIKKPNTLSLTTDGTDR